MSYKTPLLYSLLVLLFIAGGIGLWKTQNNISSDWKTYKNDQYGFTFKYPSNYFLITESAIANDSETSYVKSLNGNLNSFDSQWLRVGVLQHITGQDIGKIRTYINVDPTDEKSYIITSDTYNQLGNDVYLMLDPIRKSGAFSSISDAQNSPEVSIFKKIVSTFKFTNQIPSDWKTYSNPDYGFEFKYPSDWTIEDQKDKVSPMFKSVTITKHIDGWNDYYQIDFTRNTEATDLKPQGKEVTLADTQWIESTSFDGTPAGSPPYESQSFYRYVPNTNSDYIINTYPVLPVSDAKKTEVDNLFSQILSTFKFTK